MYYGVRNQAVVMAYFPCKLHEKPSIKYTIMEVMYCHRAYHLVPLKLIRTNIIRLKV